jgi:predicted nucleotidyltransferase component of viral defense system
MIDLKSEHTIHRSYLNRILIEIADNSFLSQHLAFKGGTCASMLGYLDRFSIDLDFDLIKKTSPNLIRKELKKIFELLNLKTKKEFSNVLMFQVQYQEPMSNRNTIKVSINTNIAKSNVYKHQYLPEINRVMTCQTIETMFANKLVAITERFKKHKSIAGRDIYDIHHFFLSGFDFNEKVIVERTGKNPKEYLKELAEFIEKNVNEKNLSQDLSFLLPYEKFKNIRKVLKKEVLMMIRSS